MKKSSKRTELGRCPICDNTGVYVDREYYAKYGLRIPEENNTIGRCCPNLCKPEETSTTIKSVIIGWMKPFEDVPYIPDMIPYEIWRKHKLEQMEESKPHMRIWRKLSRLLKR